MSKGVFYGVGIGPGDPELITVKALRALERCGVIAYPVTRGGRRLAWDIASRAADLSGKTELPLPFSMSADAEAREARRLAAAERVEAYLARGEDVAMLNLGDVSIYATCSYLMETLRERGYEAVMLPGVTSFSASAARLGLGLTEPDKPLHIVPGTADLEAALALSGTKVLLKTGRQLPRVLECLKERGLLQKTALVKNCGLPDEEVCEDLSRRTPQGDAGYFVTVIVKE